MNKKKISALTMSVLLAVGVIGGSLAYFNSQDTQINKFTTIGEDDNGESDIDIVEEFEEPTDVYPGTTVTKKVQVKNIDEYNQLIKVHFEVKLLDSNGNEVDSVTVNNGNGINNGDQVITVNDLKSHLEFGFNDTNVVNTLTGATATQWLRVNPSNPMDSEYYYLGYVSADKYTSQLLDSVKLKLDAGNEYKNIKYQVKVVADGVQAKNGAFKEVDAFSSYSGISGLEEVLTEAESTRDGSCDLSINANIS